MGKELDLDDVCAGNPLAERQLKELRDGIRSDQERIAMYGAEIARLRAEITKLLAEQKKLRSALGKIDDELTKRARWVGPADWVRDLAIVARAALAEKGE